MPEEQAGDLEKIIDQHFSDLADKYNTDLAQWTIILDSAVEYC